MGAIRINQMGYTPDSKKKVLFVGEASEFTIVDAKHNQPVYQGKLSNSKLDEASQDMICSGEFNQLQQPGNYYIRVGSETSPIFTVSKEQPQICTDALLKAFYYQRCGVELIESFAGPWKHEACHLQPSYIFRQDAEELIKVGSSELEQIDTTGGWHDAGDYGRYTVAAAKAIADLLLAYEHFHGAFDHSIDIPESELEGADLLHEVKVELDFLFKMQRTSDGAAYTKVATRFFPGMIMPEKDLEPLFIFDVSSAATADFAATMALAARIYQSFDAVYARKCLEAAKKAYEWLTLHPEPLYFKNPPHISSGEYGDNLELDERYWAAAEMYCTTGEDKYHKDFLCYYTKLKDKYILGWRNVSGYGSIAYLFTERKVDETVFEELKNGWLNLAKDLEERSRKDGYGITLTLDDYKWGSTMILLNQSMHLIIANLLLNDNKYDSVIQNDWDYLFGMNPKDISYVSGLGEKAIMAPHHRPSAGDGVENPVPGLVSGGPCAGLYDEAARKFCAGKAPAKCFVDHVGSYSTNEITIYWNSPAVYVGAYLSVK